MCCCCFFVFFVASIIHCADTLCSVNIIAMLCLCICYVSCFFVFFLSCNFLLFFVCIRYTNDIKYANAFFFEIWRLFFLFSIENNNKIAQICFVFSISLFFVIGMFYYEFQCFWYVNIGTFPLRNVAIGHSTSSLANYVCVSFQ